MQYADTESGISRNNESVFRTLDDLCHVSGQMLRKRTLTLEDTRQLADYVTQVRVLLGELEHLETGLRRSETTLSSINGMKQRYLELEGMVKEVRNSLHRSGRDKAAAF